MLFNCWCVAVTVYLPIFLSFPSLVSLLQSDTFRRHNALMGVSGKGDFFFLCLQDEWLSKSFENFCVASFAVENLFFYRHAVNYRQLKGEFQKTEAFRMRYEYISPESVFEVELNPATKERILKRIEKDEIDDSLFLEAEQEIYLAMRQAIYPLWKRSDLYKEASRGSRLQRTRSLKGNFFVTPVDINVFESEKARRQAGKKKFANTEKRERVTSKDSMNSVNSPNSSFAKVNKDNINAPLTSSGSHAKIGLRDSSTQLNAHTPSNSQSNININNNNPNNPKRESGNPMSTQTPSNSQDNNNEMKENNHSQNPEKGMIELKEKEKENVQQLEAEKTLKEEIKETKEDIKVENQEKIKEENKEENKGEIKPEIKQEESTHEQIDTIETKIESSEEQKTQENQTKKLEEGTRSESSSGLLLQNSDSSSLQMDD